MIHYVALGCVSAFCLVSGHAWSEGCPVAAADLDALADQPVDIAPWAYEWRADKEVQGKPEACFIPRRLERIDKVYRTARTALPEPELKSIHYNMPDLLREFPPQPKGELLTGLLWTGGLANCQIQLCWPSDAAIPSPADVEVRLYPTAWEWFGWTVDVVLSNPEISSDNRVWTYKSDPSAKMDWAYNVRVDAATEMVSVFSEKGTGDRAIPQIKVTAPGTGTWKRMDVEIEWGFAPQTKDAPFNGRLEPSVAKLGAIAPLPGRNRVKIQDGHAWKSRSCDEDVRRGIVVPVLYASEARPGVDSRITVHAGGGGFTFRIADLEKGPILIPDKGVFVTKAGTKMTARQFSDELAAKNEKSIRQLTRQHREAASWKELMQEVRLWTCADGTALTPFPPVEDPVMKVELSDADWTAA